METVKMLSGSYYIPVETWVDGNRQYFRFPFARGLMEEIKAMEGKKWHKDEGYWSVVLTTRNKIAIASLTKGVEDPFAKFFCPLDHLQPKRELWPHQQEILDHIFTRRNCIIAAEQGTGKTLPIIEMMEQSGLANEDIFYVSTTAGIESLRLQLMEWGSPLRPVMLTFEGLKSRVEEWGKEAPPRMLIGDESSRLKGWESQRSKAFKSLADAVREYWGDDSYVVLMTGTPAPKNPLDWWMQAEIAMPAFLRESHANKLKERLALTEWLENDAGQRYPHLITWWDNEDKCRKCGKLGATCQLPDCSYGKSIDEISLLHQRLKGMTLTIRKDEVLSWLPEKHYKVLKSEPTDEIKRLSKLVVDNCDNHMTALINLRTLSDGFNYVDEVVGKKTCPQCKGEGEAEGVDELDEFEEWSQVPEFMGEAALTSCWRCNGTGEVDKIKRSYIPIECPKLDRVSELLEAHEDGGRIVIFAAFRASLDRLQELCLAKKWVVFRVDGSQWKGYAPDGTTYEKSELVKLFQSDSIDRIVWLAHPESSGTGLTLTASPTIVYYSNTFKGEDRAQSEDRCHRPGMDLNVGLTIYDLIHLPTDLLVRDNVKNKLTLQNLTMGQIKTVFDNEETLNVRV